MSRILWTAALKLLTPGSYNTTIRLQQTTVAAMNTTTRISKAERFGHWLGRKWRGYMRGERRVSGWLVTQGLPAFVSTALVWVVKLAVLAGLFYFAFWLALLLVFAIAAARMGGKAHLHQEEDEWPFTDLSELRKQPGYDPNLYNDASHEMYTDD